jgi:hypothetical protein
MIQQKRSKWHDKTIKNKKFQKGNWALLYDSRFKEFQGKLRTRWIGPYEVDTIFPNGTIRLLTIDDSKTLLLVNGHRLRLYQRPISKEDFKATCVGRLSLPLFRGGFYPSLQLILFKLISLVLD